MNAMAACILRALIYIASLVVLIACDLRDETGLAAQPPAGLNKEAARQDDRHDNDQDDISVQDGALAPKAPDMSSDVTFEMILTQYQDLNARLARVSYDLASANIDLCPRQARSIGAHIHSVGDYPADIQPMAQAIYAIDDHLYIRTVRPGSPADRAGLKPGDRLMQVAGLSLPGGLSASPFYKAISRQAFMAANVDILVRRGTRQQTFQVVPETVCDYPAHVFFSEAINGHTDGAEIWITSELMRQVEDDVNLALVVAHEMAHAIAGHMDRQPSRYLELEADRMALIMLERAGYDIDRAIRYWAKAEHPSIHHGDQRLSSHPGTNERLAHFHAVRDEIRAKRVQGQTPNFQIP